MHLFSFIIVLVAIKLSCASLSKELVSTDANELLNWCLDSRHHKSRPGREENLTGECKSWSSNACCKANVTQAGQMEVNHYKFDVNHCDVRANRKMSPKCQQYFQRDTCFFDCEPNIGPWVVKMDRKWAKERFQHVPLCALDCDSWYDACKDDYSCATNWPKGLDWKNGRSKCREGNECRKISELFGNAKFFCETVWDHSWKYTDDVEPCMKLSFDHHGDNPNRKVAQYYLQTELGYEFSGASITQVCLNLMISLLILKFLV